MLLWATCGSATSFALRPSSAERLWTLQIKYSTSMKLRNVILVVGLLALTGASASIEGQCLGMPCPVSARLQALLICERQLS